jgi:23S rRNA (adenine2503-C2)-methyltransferase
MLNLIPYNTVEALPYRRPTWERTAEMVRKLHQRGILAKTRNSAGQEIDGGCGQLRARTLVRMELPV